LSFINVYADPARADAYANLDFPGTYHLAFRDLPAILKEHVVDRTALDFGCGAGRSTRFLKRLGYETIGIDISQRMIDLANAADPAGRYQCIESGDFTSFHPGTFGLVLSAFAFDNIPDVYNRRNLLRGLAGLLAVAGRIVIVGSTPEIYLHEWASFTTKSFPANGLAKSGDEVQIVMKDVTDSRPVVDLVWSHEDYLRLFAASGLELVAECRPLGREDEPYAWVSETSVAPWVIYTLKKTVGERHT
jgi:SAM-dependent methyltransferase